MVEQTRVSWREAKVNVTPSTTNFSLETACYDELMARHAKGERVVVAFRGTDKKWRANWVEKSSVECDMSGQRLAARGSHTPYLLITKAGTVGLSDFCHEVETNYCRCACSISCVGQGYWGGA